MIAGQRESPKKIYGIFKQNNWKILKKQINMHFFGYIIHHFFKKSDQNSKNQRSEGADRPFEKGIFVRLHKIF